MSQIYAPTRQGQIAYFKEARAKALQVGDWNVVRAMNIELATLGAMETTQPVEPMETVVPEKPRRGRKPMPRCEHGNIVGRCLDCEE